MARNRKTAAERKQEIVTNALALFKQDGYRNVTMDHIAQKCGMARTSLYEYFSNKEGILLALAEQIADEARAVQPSGRTACEQFENLAADYLERIQNHSSLYRIIFQQAPVFSGEVSKRLLEWREKFFHQVLLIAEEGMASRELRSGIRPIDAAFLFQAIVGQRAGELLMKDEYVDPGKEARYLVSLLWHGVGT
jgi:AcrR family transcriptional regulator